VQSQNVADPPCGVGADAFGAPSQARDVGPKQPLTPFIWIMNVVARFTALLPAARAFLPTYNLKAGWSLEDLKEPLSCRPSVMPSTPQCVPGQDLLPPELQVLERDPLDLHFSFSLQDLVHSLLFISLECSSLCLKPTFTALLLRPHTRTCDRLTGSSSIRILKSINEFQSFPVCTG